MKFQYILVILLICLFLFGCTELNFGTKNCGADYSCFTESFNKCESATIHYENTLLNSIITYSIVGLDNNYCTFNTVWKSSKTNNTTFETTCKIENYSTLTKQEVINLPMSKSIICE